MKGSKTKNSIEPPEDQILKETSLEIITSALSFTEKLNLVIEKSEKYKLMLFSCKSPIEFLSLLKNLITEFIAEIDKYITDYLHLKPDKNDKHCSSGEAVESEETSECYLKLEKELQKYEKKIRDQIRIEQQLKLHAESLQIKLDDNSKVIEGMEKDMEFK